MVRSSFYSSPRNIAGARGGSPVDGVCSLPPSFLAFFFVRQHKPPPVRQVVGHYPRPIAAAPLLFLGPPKASNAMPVGSRDVLQHRAVVRVRERAGISSHCPRQLRPVSKEPAQLNRDVVHAKLADLTERASDGSFRGLIRPWHAQRTPLPHQLDVQPMWP